MALFGSLLGGFGPFEDDEQHIDPFFGGHHMMRQMDGMMSAMSADPFLGMNRGFPALMGPPGFPGAPMRRLSDPFSSMGFNMLSSMDQMGRNGNCHSFSSSSVMTMTTGPDGKPQVYQATSSTRAAPDGVKETRSTVSDSNTGVRSMAIGHHIKDRSHIIEKEQNRQGELEEKQEFINIEEDDADKFNAEFRRRIQHTPALEYQSRYRPPQTEHRSNPALPSSSGYRRRSRPALAITSGSRNEDRQRRRDRDERGTRRGQRYNPAM